MGGTSKFRLWVPRPCGNHFHSIQGAKLGTFRCLAARLSCPATRFNSRSSCCGLSKRKGPAAMRRAFESRLSLQAEGLLAIGDPDILHLGSVAQEVAALGLLRVVPVCRVAIVGPGLLHVADAGKLHHGGRSFVAEAPDGVDARWLGERLADLGGASGNDVDDATGQIAGVQDGVEVRPDRKSTRLN